MTARENDLLHICGPDCRKDAHVPLKPGETRRVTRDDGTNAEVRIGAPSSNAGGGAPAPGGGSVG